MCIYLCVLFAWGKYCFHVLMCICFELCLFGDVYPRRVCLSMLFYQVPLTVCRTLFPTPLVLCTSFFVCLCEGFSISRVSLYYCVSVCLSLYVKASVILHVAISICLCGSGVSAMRVAPCIWVYCSTKCVSLCLYSFVYSTPLVLCSGFVMFLCVAARASLWGFR